MTTTTASARDDVEAIKQLKARYFRLMDTKQWDEWLRRYQKLLDEHPDGLLPAGEDRYVGLRRALEERLQALPAAVRGWYQRQYDGAAATHPRDTSAHACNWRRIR